MNSVKNAIVTMTLLAVGYGAYVVLSNPLPEDLGELSEGTVWETADVEAPTTDLGPSGEVMAINEPPPLDSPTARSGVPSTELPSADRIALPENNLDPRLANTSPPSYESAENMASAESIPSANGLSLATASGASEPSIAPPATDASAAREANTNFYVSRSGGSSADPEGYPTTTAPQLPLPNSPADGSASDARSNLPALGSPASAFEETWQSAQADLKSGQLGAALAALSAWYEEPSLTRQQADRLLPLLDQLAGTVIYSRDSFLDPAHVVQNGETLSDLAQMYQVPLKFLARVNGIEAPYEVFPGESIKVIRGPFRAEVNRSQGQITLFLGRYYAGRFPSRLGAELPAEENTYDVIAVEPGLEYFDARTGQRVGRDDPENPYGPVWISLRGNQITAAHNVGIHVDKGDPTRCCISVSPADADDLAAILGPGSSVHVHD